MAEQDMTAVCVHSNHMASSPAEQTVTANNYALAADQTNKEPAKQRHWWSRLPTKVTIGRVVEVSIVAVLIIIVWGLFTLPSILYYKPKQVSHLFLFSHAHTPPL